LIDPEGFRPNVGIILVSERGGVLWARRVGGQDAWQFPQGGIKAGEEPDVALFRELEEEIGLTVKDVEIMGVTRGWLRYRLPKRLVRPHKSPLCIGQKQKWYLLKLTADESRININQVDSPEFDGYGWVTYWHPLSKVVSFKREVYRKALKELAPAYNSFYSSMKTSGGKSAC